jgi:hypothetical protein
MKKRQIFLNPCMALLLFLPLLILVIGCERKSKIDNHVNIVEDKQLMGNNTVYDSRDSREKDTSSEINTSQTIQIKDQIQMEQWRQLIGDIKTTLSDINESTEQAR